MYWFLFLFQNTCLNNGDVNLVQFLQEIASEQQFEVTYVDVEEKSISGKSRKSTENQVSC